MPRTPKYNTLLLLAIVIVMLDDENNNYFEFPAKIKALAASPGYGKGHGKA